MVIKAVWWRWPLDEWLRHRPGANERTGRGISGGHGPPLRDQSITAGCMMSLQDK